MTTDISTEVNGKSIQSIDVDKLIDEAIGNIRIGISKDRRTAFAEEVRLRLIDRMKQARTELRRSIAPSLGSDPRRAIEGIRGGVFSNSLDAYLTMHSKGKNTSSEPKTTYPQRKNAGQYHLRGSDGWFTINPDKASARTRQLYEYTGSDRAFVLNFLAGTEDRTVMYGWTDASGMRHISKESRKKIPGDRVNFLSSASALINRVANEIAADIEKKIQEKGQ